VVHLKTQLIFLACTNNENEGIFEFKSTLKPGKNISIKLENYTFLETFPSRILSGSCTEDICYWDITKNIPLFTIQHNNMLSNTVLIGLKIIEENIFWMAGNQSLQCIDIRQNQPIVYDMNDFTVFTAFDIWNGSHSLARMTADFSEVVFNDTRKMELITGKNAITIW